MKLIPLSKITPKKRPRTDEMRNLAGSRERGHEVLMQAQQYWFAMDHFRKERERNLRYTFGNQWGDPITVDCETMTEAEYLRREGNTPLENNLIRRLVRNVVGFYRNQNNEPVCNARDRDEQQLGQVMTGLLQYNGQLNKLMEVRARQMEEFLISGLVAERSWYGWQHDKADCWTNIVPANNFIIDNNMLDVRGWDCSFVGELHDVDYNTLCAKFARTPSEYKYLQELYASARNSSGFSQRWQDFGYQRQKSWDFFCGNDHSRCRVIEVWRKETRPRYRCHDPLTAEFYKIEASDYEQMVGMENAKRIEMGMQADMPYDEIPQIEAEWFVDTLWVYYFLSPFGDILDEGETPFEHKGHPYVFKAYPFIDGEIHSFVSDVIDQQRFINRLITMHDMAVRSSIKGLMMVPLECVPDGMSPEQFAEMSTSYRGVLFYKSKGNVQLPSVITSNSTNIGATELLNIQLKLMEDISGVHGALQGKTPTSGTSGTLYAQQTENATTSLVDVVSSFQSYETESAYKVAKNIQQFYEAPRIRNIIGKDAWIDNAADKVRNLEFDIAITENSRTPVYREMANQFLSQMCQTGQITLPQLLRHGNFPFGDGLLQELETQERQQQEAMAQQQQAMAAQQSGGQMPAQEVPQE